ncbi:hypothetical protein G7Z17_g5474 [Cylindrodendrum hubeiense]|uniref:Zn(2)-C6 fungal-type domain-containing protein n=1 Tax=Cylindrodendrum hubeiense TaxID=595255 RepID=A0A9P5HE28_9HYPO|nr:hypothetical protein G7Z17_g5474 [Cylindrodendrum hubeiense]
MAIPAMMPAGLETTEVPDRTVYHSSTAATAATVNGDSDPDAAATAGTAAAIIKRRAPIACRRCRRMRSKCVHDKAQPPCKACLESGLSAQDCIFPVRGQPDNDREFRHPRMRADKTGRRDPIKVRRDTLEAPVVRPPGSKADEWDRLPPLPDLIDGVNRFTRHYFQHGFIPKQQFPARLHHDPRSVSVFLVVCILSISARLTPALAARYGSGIKAAEFFMERASQLAYGELYQEPTLERCQGFYLLSIAQQGSGLKNMSYINMGVSMRMASLMRLHREETYQIQNPSPEVIMRAEAARRTLWMLHSQDQLHSSPYSPVSLAASDITTLLPCDEQDFAAGRQPRSRAALEGTPPANENPALIFDPNRSLFASMVQAHHFWGLVSRRAVNFARSDSPWDPNSEVALIIKKLRDWEQGLPQEHQWSPYFFKEYKSDGQDLAYLGVTMIPRLCNIVSRRPYLIDSQDEQKRAFFSNLSLELFHNVRRLFDQIDAQFTGRSPDESVGAQMAAFCVYSCGLFATYLCRYPNICPDPMIVRDGPMMLHRTLAILMECKEVWPLASRWVEALEQFARDPSGSLGTEGSMADGKDPVPNPVAVPAASSMNATASASASTSSVPSPSSSSFYGRTRGSFDATQTPSTLQSPSHELMTPLTPTTHTMPSHFAQQQQQQQQQHHQQQQQQQQHQQHAECD